MTDRHAAATTSGPIVPRRATRSPTSTPTRPAPTASSSRPSSSRQAADGGRPAVRHHRPRQPGGLPRADRAPARSAADGLELVPGVEINAVTRGLDLDDPGRRAARARARRRPGRRGVRGGARRASGRRAARGSMATWQRLRDAGHRRRRPGRGARPRRATTRSAGPTVARALVAAGLRDERRGRVRADPGLRAARATSRARASGPSRRSARSAPRAASPRSRTSREAPTAPSLLRDLVDEGLNGLETTTASFDARDSPAASARSRGRSASWGRAAPTTTATTGPYAEAHAWLVLPDAWSRRSGPRSAADGHAATTARRYHGRPHDHPSPARPRHRAAGRRPGRPARRRSRPTTSASTEFRPEVRALPSFFVWTLGCQMNKSDSEEMAGRLLAAGCAEAPSMDAADLVVINTCAIREAAEAKVIGRQGAPAPAEGREPRPARGDDRLLGARVEPGRPRSAATRRWTCSCGPTRSPSSSTGWASRRRRRRSGATRRRDDAWSTARRCRTRPTSSARAPTRSPAARSPRHSAISAWLPIIYGCDKTCTYCIVPFSRGPERSRPFDEIVDEARALAAAGYREVTLLGQNVNSYGHDLEPEPRFGHIHTARTVGPPPGPRGPARPRRADPGDRRAADRRRRARDPAPALRDLAPVGPVRPPDRGDGRLPVGVRGPPPAGPVGQRHDAPAHGPPVHDRALPRAPRPDPRGGPGHRALDRRHRRVLRRDRGGVRGDAPAARDRPLRPGLRGGLQRAARDARDAPRRTTCPPPRSDAGSSSCWRSRRASGSSATGRGSGGRPRSSSTRSCRREHHDHDDEEAAGTAESRDAFAHLPDGVAHLAGRSRENKLVHVAGSPDARRPPGRGSASTTPGRTRFAGSLA